MKIRIGTRGSALALVQSRAMAARLEAAGHAVELVTIRTAGDSRQDVPFDQIGPAGVFAAEIELALLEQRIDLGVHSYKDLPSSSPDGLVVAAVPERVDVADVLLVRGESIDRNQPLPVRLNGTIGTSSSRRRSWIRDQRPDLQPLLLRGNLPTRVEKLLDGEYDAILLARAGILRLTRDASPEHPDPLPLDGLLLHRLDPGRFVPAPSQGALALQVRRDDPQTLAAARALDDAEAHRAVRAERALLELVEGSCDLPFGACCHALDEDPGLLEMIAMLGTDHGTVRVEGRHADPIALARLLWQELRPHRSGKGDR